MIKPNNTPEISAISCSLIIWVVILFGLTGLGVLSLILTGVDQSKAFSPAILLIGYAPSLAALCTAGFLSGAGGVRCCDQLGNGALVSSGMPWFCLARWCWFFWPT